ncbi:MEDS domain-containing protein [Streptomyces sp. NPDC058657]|uniref:MEDS domain-containing protein n=1 Tax=unclassified Streptomyces TaxID=2593676 RepID=UPI0036669405
MGGVFPERTERHSSIVYSDDHQWAGHLRAFVREGLERDEAMLYFADATDPARVLRTLTDAGIDAQGAVRRGQLSLPEARTHLADSGFDPDAMIALWYEAVDTALGRGHRGLRVIEEMSWGMRENAGVDRLLEYELRIHHEVFERLPLTAWCFYDRRLVSDEGVNVLAGAHLTHRGNTVAQPTLQVAPLSGSPGFLLRGSAGYDTRRIVAATAAAVATAPGTHLELDFSTLHHLDADSLVTLAQAAASRPGNVPLRIREAPPTLRRLLDLFPELSSSMEVVAR